MDENGAPRFTVAKGVHIIHDMTSAAQEMTRKFLRESCRHFACASSLEDFFSDDESLEQFESNCRLCVALWGRLDGVHADDEEVDHETEEASYLHRIARRHAVADWLSITGMKRVESSGEKVRIFFRAWNVFEGFFPYRTIWTDWALCFRLSKLGRRVN